MILSLHQHNIFVIHYLHPFDNPCHFLLVHLQDLQIIHLLDGSYLIVAHHHIYDEEVPRDIYKGEINIFRSVNS